MKIVDGQIHVWDENKPDRPWNEAFAQSRAAFLSQGQAVTADRAIAALDAIGVDGALVTSFMLYSDVSYALAAVRQYPSRFRLVPQLDLNATDPFALAEEYCSYEEVAALRLSFLVEKSDLHYARLAAGEYAPIFRLAEKSGLPVMLVVSGHPLAAETVAVANPNVSFIVDHLGVVQGPHREMPEDPFAKFGELVSLARYSNVAVKLSGAPCLSREEFPYLDLWPHLERVIQAFGPHRLMWGSDFSRTRPLHNYAQSLFYLEYSDRLSPAEKELILGKSLCHLVRWRGVPSPIRHDT